MPDKFANSYVCKVTTFVSVKTAKQKGSYV